MSVMMASLNAIVPRDKIFEVLTLSSVEVFQMHSGATKEDKNEYSKNKEQSVPRIPPGTLVGRGKVTRMKVASSLMRTSTG